MNLFDTLSNPDPFFLIAGPCVVEDRETMLKTADFLKKISEKQQIPLIFKASYKKANRTSETSFAGPGIQEGLKMLEMIKEQFELPILTDVHETFEVHMAADVCDIIQIPAFLCRQTELIHAAALTGKIVNLKKGQFMAPEDMQSASEKATAANNYQIILTERGSSFGYHNLVVDFRSFAILNSMHYPVVYDVTHSLQKPSLNRISGGNPEFAAMMARAAIATNMVHGLFIETHPSPLEALSDSASMLPLADLEDLIVSCLKIKHVFEDNTKDF